MTVVVVMVIMIMMMLWCDREVVVEIMVAL